MLCHPALVVTKVSLICDYNREEYALFEVVNLIVDARYQDKFKVSAGTQNDNT